MSDSASSEEQDETSGGTSVAEVPIQYFLVAIIVMMFMQIFVDILLIEAVAGEAAAQLATIQLLAMPALISLVAYFGHRRKRKQQRRNEAAADGAPSVA